MPNFTFKKAERLKSRKVISRLFKEGKSFSTYPLRIIWIPTDSSDNTFPAQFSMSVPRRSFAKAVQRNDLRRRIRESYRLNKHLLYQHLENSDQQYGLMFIYVAKEALPYSKIELAMKKILKRLTHQLP